MPLIKSPKFTLNHVSSRNQFEVTKWIQKDATSEEGTVIAIFPYKETETTVDVKHHELKAYALANSFLTIVTQFQ